MRYTYALLSLICLTVFAKEAQLEKQPLLQTPSDGPAEIKKATTSTPTQVRLAIGRAKIVAFSKDYLIKSGLEDKDLVA